MNDMLFPKKKKQKKKGKRKAYKFPEGTRCYISKCLNAPIAHHIIFGDKYIRDICEDEGLMLPVCNRPHHIQDSDLSIHENYEICRVVQVKAQMKYMIREGVNEDQFRDIFKDNFMIHENKARESIWWNKISFELQPRRI